MSHKKLEYNPLITSAKAGKPFPELTHDEKLMITFRHAINYCPDVDVMDEEFWEERRHMIEFAQERLREIYRKKM